MRHISKGKEPDRLLRHRLSGTASYTPTYDTLDSPTKQELRETLANEQGFLCCYCMSPIDASEAGMRIEHFKPQSNHPKLQLDHRNLLAACTGGEGRGHTEHTCDVRKGDRELVLDPTAPQFILDRQLRYSSTGSIEALDPRIEQDIEDHLNLNVHRLREARKQALDSVLTALNSGKNKGKSLSASELCKVRETWASPKSDGRQRAYCQVVVHWLDRKIKQRG